MSEAILEIKTWGNSLGVRIPSAVARAARLKVSQSVKLTVEDGRVVITPQGPKPLTLFERVERYDPAVHGGEVMVAPLIGAEKL
ncbi:MAG: AbrB/MazE/SpoVT family DNA-binding domain-containing protein [Gammaproteobacteria bacterium]